MKRLVSIIAAFIFSVSAVKATTPDTITITAANAKTYVPGGFTGKDYLAKIDLGASTLPSFAPGHGTHVWDLRAVVYDTTVRPVISRIFAIYPYQYGDSASQSFGGNMYSIQKLSTYSLSGITAWGVHIDSQSLFFNSPTPGAIDTVTFLDQDTFYTSRYTVLPFPCSIDTTWSSSFTYTPGFVLTDTSAGYLKKGGNLSVHYSEMNSVIGSGRMLLKEPSADTLDTTSVLQVRTIGTEVDSFFLSGNPLSGSYLTAFGLVQGNVINTYSLSFYRLGRITPLVKINYTDNSFSTIQSMYVDTLIPVPTGVALISAGEGMKIYPNPTINHTVYVEAGKVTTGAWNYQLISISGQVIATGALPFNQAGQTKVGINIPASVAPGVYYLSIMNDGKPARVQPISIQN